MNDQSKIVKVKKNTDGDITDVMLTDGNIYPIEDAIMMAKDGKIEGINVGRGKNGREHLRSNPNDSQKDNLDQLDTF